MICCYDRQRIKGKMTSSVAVVVKASSTMFHLYSEIGGTSPHYKTGVESRGHPSIVANPHLVEVCMQYASFLYPPRTTCEHQRDWHVCRDSICLLLLPNLGLQCPSKAALLMIPPLLKCQPVSNTRLDPFFCNKNRLRNAPALRLGPRC
jgi:hypothetical protein